MTRKCSRCSKIGHNSRTCGGFGSGSVPSATAASTNAASGSVRLFGVRIGASHSSLSAISKCVSMDCISSASADSSSPSASSPHPTSRFVVEENPAFVEQIVAFGVVPGSQGLINKGVPWSEDEHKQFLLGLEKLGKGDWRGISKHFVHTRTPTQVASHAQKYFLRQASLDDNKKRRSSLFDMVSGNNKDQSPKRRNPIPTDQHLSGRRRPSSPNQWLVEVPRTFDLSLGWSSNNADHSSASSSPPLCLKHAKVDLDLTLGAPRLLPSSSLGAMRVI